METLKDKNIITYVLLNLWITNNFNELNKICKKIAKGQEHNDLLQLCIEQFINNKKVLDIPDNEKLYFFTRIVLNNFNSKTSHYYRQYKKFNFVSEDNFEFEDVVYEESQIDLDWVYKQIENDKKDGDWYYARLFQIYIEQGCSVTKTSKLTSIPINSASRDINKYRKHLNKLREQIIK